MLPTTLVPMSLRCCELWRGSVIRFCGEIASFVRPGGALRGDRFFCERHRQPGDEAIPVGQPFERVRLELVVEIAGVVPGIGVCRTEAIATVERVLERLGAVVEVVSVSSTQVRNAATGAAPREIGASALPK